MNRGTKVKGNSLVTGVDTGFQQLNKFTQGFHPGELIILAARPSSLQRILIAQASWLIMK